MPLFIDLHEVGKECFLEEVEIVGGSNSAKASMIRDHTVTSQRDKDRSDNHSNSIIHAKEIARK